MYMWSPKLHTSYHGKYICGRGYQLPQISIILIFGNISSKAERKKMFDHYQTCYRNSTGGTIHGSIWKNKQCPTVNPAWCQNLKYWVVVRHYAHYWSTTNKPSSHVWLCFFFWHSSVTPRHKQFSRAQSVVVSTKVTCSWSVQLLNGI